MYLVTGATGNVGSQVVNKLLEGGKKVRVFSRDPAKVAHWGDRVQVVIGDFGKSETFAQAFVDVEGAFLMNGGLAPESFKQLVATAKAHGNPRIAFLSTILAGDPEFLIGKLHKDKEDLIRESGLPGKFIRPGGFMTNTFQWVGTIKAEGIVYNPMGTGKSALISPDDIASVTVKALTTPSVDNEEFPLTGGELLSVPEQVRILADVLGKPIQCIDIPSETAIQGLIRAGVPPHVATAVAQSYDAVRDGRAVVVTDTVEKVTGSPPKTFAAWVKENASRFV